MVNSKSENVPSRKWSLKGQAIRMLAAEQKSKSTDILICFSFLQCSTSLPSLLCRATNPFQTPATQAIPDRRPTPGVHSTLC